jgi:drug/metabolite transporter (DMT)-like permease
MSSVQAAQRSHVDALAITILVVLCALWGVQQVAVKVAVTGGLPPVLQAGMRSAVAALCVAGWVGARQGRAGLAGLFSRDTLLPGMGLAVLFGLEFLLLFPGLAMTTAARGVVFLYTAPFFTALGAHLLLPAERMTGRQALGLLIAFGGVAATFAEGLLHGQGGSITGDLMCLAGGAMWGLSTVAVKASRPLARSPSSKLLFLQLAGSAPLLLFGAWVLGEHVALPAVLPVAWAGLFYQTIIVAFVSYLTWFRLILIYPVGRVAGFTFLTPLFGILAGAALLGEHVSPALLVGLVAIAVGMRLVNSRGR